MVQVLLSSQPQAVLDVIASAMRTIGALASGESPSDAEAADGLAVLNDMLDSWTAERGTIFTVNIATYPLTPGKQTYTLGPQGDFNTNRPARIDSVSIVSLTNPAQPLELEIAMYSDEDWQHVPVKNITTTLPLGVYDDGGYPLRSLSFFPIPTVAVNTVIYSWTALGAFPDLTVSVIFPPGYKEAVRYNLALRLIAEMPGNYNQIMLATTAKLANESLARIRSMNLPTVEAEIDPGLTGDAGHYDYRSDSVVGRGRTI